MKQQESDNTGTDALTLNQALVEALKNKGCIHTSSVEAAFRAVPRHLFVPGVRLEEVYSDRAISVKIDKLVEHNPAGEREWAV